MQRIRVRGVFFRLVDARDADAILETGSGFAYGGRYAPPGEFGTLDLGEIMVDLPRVLDLTDSRTLLHTTPAPAPDLRSKSGAAR